MSTNQVFGFVFITILFNFLELLIFFLFYLFLLRFTVIDADHKFIGLIKDDNKFVINLDFVCFKRHHAKFGHLLIKISKKKTSLTRRLKVCLINFNGQVVKFIW